MKPNLQGLKSFNLPHIRQQLPRSIFQKCGGAVRRGLREKDKIKFP